MEFKVDLTALNEFTDSLIRINRYAFPSAVKNTLNSAAFDVKKRTILSSSKREMTERNKNFIKRFSSVDRATGLKLQSMVASVGFDRIGGNNYATDDLEQQDSGGRITNKAFIAMNQARTGNSSSRLVKRKNRLDVINDKRFTSVNKKSAKTKKQQFVRAAFYAVGKEDGLVLGHKTKSGGRTLFKIEMIRQNIKTRRLQIKYTPLYNVKKGRSIKVEGNDFAKKAGEESALKMPEFYIENANFQFQKYMKK